ncbi:MAG: permease [Candidatus Thermoplasmatota archaeon]|nr:permease [Candidatus Thermoplasmatota archaeon]
MFERSIGSGISTLASYLSDHVVTCLIPAFFIAGGISAFISQASVLKYFSARTKKYISYSIASVSGVILAVCSCTVIPLFTGIYKRGAGIGPSTTFLFAGPAINVLAIFYTANALGYDLGIARAVSAVLMSIVVGLTMALIFRKEEKSNRPMMLFQDENKRHIGWTVLFFALMVGILVILTAGYIPMLTRVIIAYMLTIAVGVVLIFKYEKKEVKIWGRETWDLTLKIFPVLVIGTFGTGILAYFIPPDIISPLMGSNSIFSTFSASVIGAILYMPTLLEVPIIGEIFGYSTGAMSPGAALSLLLAGPSLSLPNMIVITRVMGIKRTSVYVVTVVILSTIAGFIYGNLMAVL